MQDFISIVNDTIRRGQQAQGVMGTAVVEDYFKREAESLTAQILDMDLSDMDKVTATLLRYQAVKQLHDHLTRAVRDGLDAAASLSKQAKQGA